MPARSAAPREARRLPRGALLAWALAMVVTAAPAVGQEPAERTYLFALKAYRDGLYDVAAQGFRDYLASAPPRAQEPEANFFLGRALIELGRDEEALAALEASARADDEGRVAPLARHLKARRYLDLGRLEEAEAETGRWLKYFPSHSLQWEVRLVRGQAWVGLGNLQEAALLFGEVAQAKEAPEEVGLEALWRLASVAASEGKDEGAARAWEALVKRAPESPRAAGARLQLAARSARASRYKEALAQAQALLKAFPASPEAGPARLLRAESLFGLGRWAEASDAYEEAARSGGPEAFGQVHWERAGLAAYRAGRLERAVEALGRAGDGPQGENLALRFAILRKAKEPERALEVARSLLTRYPKSPLAAEALAPSVELARATGRWSDLREGLAAYLKGAPPETRPEARYLLAHGELQAGRPEEAARLFAAVAAEGGGLDRYRDVRYKQAVSLLAARQPRKAMELLEALDPGEREVVGERGVLALEADIHRAMGNYQSSADRYRALLTQWPTSPEAGRWLLALAELEEARGRPGEALAAYRKWLEGRASEPAAAGVRLAVARLQVAAGRAEEALQTIEELVTAGDPQVAAQALLLKGRIALERGEYQAALEASSKAAEGLPKESPAYALARWRVGRALEETGRAEEAASHYRWLAKHAPAEEVRQASKERLKRLASPEKPKKAKTTP